MDVRLSCWRCAVSLVPKLLRSSLPACGSGIRVSRMKPPLMALAGNPRHPCRSRRPARYIGDVDPAGERLDVGTVARLPAPHRRCAARATAPPLTVTALWNRASRRHAASGPGPRRQTSRPTPPTKWPPGRCRRSRPHDWVLLASPLLPAGAPVPAVPLQCGIAACRRFATRCQPAPSTRTAETRHCRISGADFCPRRCSCPAPRLSLSVMAPQVVGPLRRPPRPAARFTATTGAPGPARRHARSAPSA